ncbi:MAG: sigma 54-interacting transcriptional regulator [Fusobacteriaceae bacterium]|jgi:PAS domain S-box-containing protein|nr:sigma 54-interacting transcriptional regulator [Fusobacteriaceae bacterium]
MKQENELYKYIFYKILQMSDDGFIITDTDGIVTDINDTYCRFLNEKKENIEGKSILNIIPNTKLIDIMKNRYSEEGVIHTYMAGNPREEKVMVNRSYVENDKGEIVGGVGQIRFKFQSLDIAKKFIAEYEQLEYYKEEYHKIGHNLFSFENIIGSSPNFLKIKMAGIKAAKTNFSVLLTGETGTGKEVFAKAIHNSSPRANKPIVSIDCAAIPEELMESELFGYEEGAFTGAKRGGKKGKFLIADGGTLFLDEIGDMPLKMQAKLLRVLQEREIEPVGSLETIPIDVRIIAATRKNLPQMIKAGEFREDLFYRLNVINIEMIPLRERKDDILEMAAYFLQGLNQDTKGIKAFSKEVLKYFREYSWPGNIRELDNVIKSAYASSDGLYIETIDLPLRILNKKDPDGTESRLTLPALVENYERELLESALKRNNWNCIDVAREMGVHRSAIYKKMKKYGLARRMKRTGDGEDDGLTR